MLQLRKIPIEDKQKLGELIKDYQREMLSIEPEQYKHLDSYWEKPNRYPYYIENGGQIIGFVLINAYTVLAKDAKSISEFYIKKEFRRNGFGKEAAIKSFDLFLGKWEVRELKENKVAHLFWNNVIKEYTSNHFSEDFLDNELWSGPIQVFDSSATN
jgi:predicted acetyltransferase